MKRRHVDLAKWLLLAIALCFPAAPSVADEAAKANRLMIEAIGYMQEAQLASAANRRYALLKEAHDRLVAIVERFPSTALAVKLATGQSVGNVSLEAVRAAMNEALDEAMRPAQPGGAREPGVPLQAWRLDAGVVALGLPFGKPWAWMLGRDGVAVFRDIETGRKLSRWRGPGRPTAGALSPDGGRILTAFERQNTVVLRDTSSLNMLRGWEHNGPVSSVALSQDASKALVGIQSFIEPGAYLMDVIALKAHRTWSRRAPPTAVAWSPDGRLVLAGFADGVALLGDATSGRILYEWKHPGSGAGGIVQAAFSGNGHTVLVGAANWRAVLRDTRSGRTLRVWNAGNRIKSVALSRDGQWALTGDNDWEVELHDARTGRTVRKWRYESWPTAVAFSPDGRRVLMGFGDGAVILCEIRVPDNTRRYTRTYLSAEGGCW